MRISSLAVVAALALPHTQAARQDAPQHITGPWVALKKQTVKGMLEFDPAASSFTLAIEGDGEGKPAHFKFRTPAGSARARSSAQRPGTSIWSAR